MGAAIFTTSKNTAAMFLAKSVKKGVKNNITFGMPSSSKIFYTVMQQF